MCFSSKVVVWVLENPTIAMLILFLFEPIDFLSKMVACRFSLNLPLFGLGPASKGHGSNLWLSSNRSALFHWTLDLGNSSKVALILALLMWDIRDSHFSWTQNPSKRKFIMWIASSTKWHKETFFLINGILAFSRLHPSICWC